MKKWYIIVGVLCLLTLTTTAVFLVLMPDRVPMHYNFAGEMDRMGSKYENLLWPGVSLVMAGIFVLAAKEKKTTEKEQKILLLAAIYTLLLFYVLGVYFMYKALRYGSAAEVAGNQFDQILRFTMLGTGVLLVLLSNLMPKTTRNALFGIRTTWSQYSDTTWRKSQRFGAFSGVLCGGLIILSAVFFSGSVCLVIDTVLVLVWAVAAGAASWKYYREETAKDGQEPHDR